MNLKKLEEKLKNFDYTYMMSDDHSVWQKGTEEEKKVRQYIRELIEKDIENIREIRKLINKHKQKYGVQFINEVMELKCSKCGGKLTEENLKDDDAPKFVFLCEDCGHCIDIK